MSLEEVLECKFASCGFKTISPDEFYDHRQYHIAEATSKTCVMCGEPKERFDIICTSCKINKVCLECGGSHGRHTMDCVKIQ